MQTAHFSRRAFLAGAAALPALTAPARGQLQIELKGGQFRPIPIAIADFAGEGEAAKQASRIIANNLKRSGYFAPIDPAAFVEKATNPDAVPQFEMWKAVNAQALVTGRVIREGAQFQTQFRLWDVYAGQQTTGQQYSTGQDNSRRVAHLISDAIWEAVIGEKGHFDSRVVFVDESGPKEKRRKRLAIMDQDGANLRFLTSGNDLVVTPRFSPTAQQIAYMSFAQGGNARVIVQNLDTNARQTVGDFPGMTFAPRFSPDGSRLLMSLQQGGNANLFLYDLRARSSSRVTDAAAIDTSGSFSPDGAQIVFESDRGGAQQIYLTGAGGGAAKRISFGEGSYSTPVWSPKGDLIAFTKRKGGAFAIGVMRPDSSGERILTEGFHNEGPTWSPNGRFLMFFRDPGGNSGARIYMVDVTGRVEVPVPTPSFGSDPAWGPLLGG